MKITVAILLIFLTLDVCSQTLYTPGGTVTTNSPSTFMEFKSNGIWDGSIRANTNGTGQYSSFGIYENSLLRWAIYNHPGINHALLFANSNGQDHFTFTQDGKLGIGTLTPSQKLDVNGGIASRGQLVVDADATEINVGDLAGGDGLRDKLHLWTRDTKRVTINENGYVGIGTINPQAALDIGVNISSGTMGTVFGRLPEGNGVGQGTFLGVRGYGTQPIVAKSFAIEHAFYGTVNNSINFFRGDGITGGFIGFNTNDNTEKMRIEDNGYVGIGTSTPNAKLHINGGDLLLQNQTSGYPILWLKNVSGSQSIRLDYNSIIGAGDNLYLRSGGSNNILLNDVGGGVGIGTSNVGSFKLAVNGKVWAQEVQVALTNPGPDYVFSPNYKLLSLEEIKNYIDQHKHLPEVPSAKEMETNGVNVSEMNMILLRKIEELTLHLIEQNKIIAQLQEERRASPSRRIGTSGKKIEELTLYQIQSNKKIQELEQTINELKSKSNE